METESIENLIAPKLNDISRESWQGYQLKSFNSRATNYYEKQGQNIKESRHKPKAMSTPDEGHIDTAGLNLKYLSVMKKLELGSYGLVPENNKLLLAFISDAELGKTIKQGRKKKVSKGRIVKYVQDLAKLDHFIRKPFDLVNLADMESFIRALENGKISCLPRTIKGAKKGLTSMPRKDITSPETIKTIKDIIKKFYKWLKGENRFYPELVDWIDTSIEVKEYKAIKKDQVDKALAVMISNTAANLIRNKALLTFLFDSGARADELLNIRLKHLSMEGGNYMVRIEYSKTKKRTIKLPLYKQQLDAWLDIHPSRDEPSAQLFPMQYQPLRMLITRIGEQIGFKGLTPHSLRHGSVTYYANYLKDNQLKYRYGWSKNTRQLERYIDQEGLEQKDAIQQICLAEEQQEVDKLRGENKELNQRLAMLEEQMGRLLEQDKQELIGIIRKLKQEG